MVNPDIRGLFNSKPISVRCQNTLTDDIANNDILLLPNEHTDSDELFCGLLVKFY
jgi:hypothetical protein